MRDRPIRKLAVTHCVVYKEDLLKILKAEAYVPVDSTRIIGTGHTPEMLIVTVDLPDSGMG